MPLFTDSLLGALIVYGEYTIYAWGGLTKMVERFIWRVTYPYTCIMTVQPNFPNRKLNTVNFRITIVKSLICFQLMLDHV